MDDFHNTVQHVKPALLRLALRLFAIDLQLKALLHQHITVGVQNVAVPLKPGFSQPVGSRSDAVPLPDVIVADVIKTSDTTAPTQHLCLHDTKVTFGFSCCWPAFSSIECNWPDDHLVELQLETVADLLAAKNTSHRVPLSRLCHSGLVTQAAISGDC